MPVQKNESYTSLKSANANQKWLHFLAAVEKLQKRSEYKSRGLMELCAIANANPAPRYYLSSFHVLEIYNEWKRTGILPVASKMHRKMYLEIFSKYEAFTKDKNISTKKVSYMEAVLAQPASSFFIENVTKFYYRAAEYKRKLNRQRLCHH